MSPETIPHEWTTETVEKKAWHTPDVVELDMRKTQSGQYTTSPVEDTFCQS